MLELILELEIIVLGSLDGADSASRGTQTNGETRPTVVVNP